MSVILKTLVLVNLNINGKCSSAPTRANKQRQSGKKRAHTWALRIKSVCHGYFRCETTKHSFIIITPETKLNA